MTMKWGIVSWCVGLLAAGVGLGADACVSGLQPGQKLERIPFDSSSFERLPLRETEPGHWAAV